MQDSPPLTLAAAQQILRHFICLEHDRATTGSAPTPQQIQQALRLVAQHSDYQIFGICADTQTQAIAALQAYLSALGYEEVVPEPIETDAAIYIKYNRKTGLCYAAPYTGIHRGVLVSCQSVEEDDVNETFGHLPLDLFS